jgi:hypothetical protein
VRVCVRVCDTVTVCDCVSTSVRACVGACE